MKGIRILCGELGGTWCRTAIVEISLSDLHLLPQTFRSVRTQDLEHLDAVLACTAWESLRAASDASCSYLCLAVAGAIDNHRIVRTAANIRCLQKQSGLDLADTLRAQLASVLPQKHHASMITYVVNDLEAAIIGEVEKGALGNCHWALMENIGSGWGGAMLCNNDVVAAEPGHIWMHRGGEHRRCGCGRMNCAEAYYSGAAVQEEIVRLCDELGIQIPEEQHPCTFADAQVRAGTPWAALLYKDVARGIGEIWGSRLNLCPTVEKIVYMGTFITRAMALPFFRETVQQAFHSRTLFPERHAAVEITPSRVPQRSLQNPGDKEHPLGALYGAAWIFVKNHRSLLQGY